MLLEVCGLISWFRLLWFILLLVVVWNLFVRIELKIVLKIVILIVWLIVLNSVLEVVVILVWNCGIVFWMVIVVVVKIILKLNFINVLFK